MIYVCTSCSGGGACDPSRAGASFHAPVGPVPRGPTLSSMTLLSCPLLCGVRRTPAPAAALCCVLCFTVGLQCHSHDQAGSEVPAYTVFLGHTEALRPLILVERGVSYESSILLNVNKTMVESVAGPPSDRGSVADTGLAQNTGPVCPLSQKVTAHCQLQSFCFLGAVFNIQSICQSVKMLHENYCVEYK